MFFGREHETSEIIGRLGDPRSRFLAVIGASGAGKSSLVNAGVIPELRRGAIPGADRWEIIRFTPGEIEGSPFLALAARLSDGGASGTAQEITQKLERDPGSFHQYVDSVLKGSPAWNRLLLVIDQFEELFGSGIDERQRAQFVAVTAEAAKSERVVIVITLRADFYAHCLDHPDLAALLRIGSFPLSSAGLGALFRMITRPAEIAGLTFEGQLAERILDDAGAEPGRLALMAFALNLVAQHASDGNLLISEYERIGGIQGAIATRAEEVFDTLTEDDRAQLPKLFRRLTDVSEAGVPVRRRARLNSLADDQATRRLIALLTQARLMVVSDDEEHREATIEVSHEALFGSWPRLAEWIQQTRDDMVLLRQLRRAAADWDRAGRPDTFLWPHERLIMAEAMVQNLDPELDPVIEEFIIPEVTRILTELEGDSTHQRRASLGDRLFEIGDNRPGVGLTAEGLPDILWRTIPGGRVIIRDLPEIQIPDLQLAAYPVTYGQYQAFLDDPDGFQNPAWFDGLAMRPETPGRQFRAIPNHPAENISWYDAIAFCRWLTAKSGIPVRLPTDWEWQLAVGGPGDGSRYAWGPQWDDAAANTLESGVSRTMAVGLYLGSGTPEGIHDAHGNVWEWCLNQLPDTSVEGVDFASEGARVVRGGSWFVASLFAKSTFRGWDDPELRYSALGFRLLRERADLDD
ncbi:hypothetical protein GCM10010160_56220 [Acrocarpospora corrugata]